MPKNSNEEKPKRLYFKSYLQVIRNSVGSNIFRNFYVETSDKGEFDAFGDGENSCAFFVSGILVLFAKLHGIHGTVSSAIKDLRESGWQEVNEPEPGDVLIWESQQFADGLKEHIGFYLGDGRAVSTSNKTKAVVEHAQNFGEANRKITRIYRMTDWNDDTPRS